MLLIVALLLHTCTLWSNLIPHSHTNARTGNNIEIVPNGYDKLKINPAIFSKPKKKQTHENSVDIFGESNFSCEHVLSVA